VSNDADVVDAIDKAVPVEVQNRSLRKVLIPIVLSFVGLLGYQEVRGAPLAATEATEAATQVVTSAILAHIDSLMEAHRTTGVHPEAVSRREFDLHVRAQTIVDERLLRVLERIEARLDVVVKESGGG
jgi:hypothetical protein